MYPSSMYYFVGIKCIANVAFGNLGKKVAQVQDARYDSCSRNVLRYDDLAECVQLGRVKDHFICMLAHIQQILSY